MNKRRTMPSSSVNGVEILAIAVCLLVSLISCKSVRAYFGERCWKVGVKVSGR